MRATLNLVKEHEVILVALELLEKLACQLDPKATEQAADLERLLDFFRDFADACHHGKEERVLFPALMATGAPHATDVLRGMLDEHEVGRALVQRIRSGLQDVRYGHPDAAVEVRKAAWDYRHLLSAHISREDHVLFPMAERHLSEMGKASLVVQFEQIEGEVSVRLAALQGLLDGLTERYLELVTLPEG